MSNHYVPQLTAANSGGQPGVLAGVRAAKAVARDEGVSEITIWRRGRAGLIDIVRISNRPYVTVASLQAFYRRAAAGEFAKPPTGAAQKSAQARAAKENAT